MYDILLPESVPDLAEVTLKKFINNYKKETTHYIVEAINQRRIVFMHRDIEGQGTINLIEKDDIKELPLDDVDSSQSAIFVMAIDFQKPDGILGGTMLRTFKLWLSSIKN